MALHDAVEKERVQRHPAQLLADHVVEPVGVDLPGSAEAPAAVVQAAAAVVVIPLVTGRGLLDDVGRRHHRAALPALDQAAEVHVQIGLRLAPRVAGDHGLDVVEQLPRDDRLVLAGERLPVMYDLAGEDRVTEEMPDHGVAVVAAAAEAAVDEDLLGLGQGAGLGVGLEDAAGDGGALRVHHQAAALGPVAQGRAAAGVEAAADALDDLVLDALGGQLALELGEGEHDVAEEAAGGGGGVEALRDGDEADLVALEDLDELVEVPRGAGEAVDLIGDDHVEFSPLDVAEEALEGGAGGVGPGEAGVGVGARVGEALLAGDEGADAVFLGLAGAELLLGLLVGRDAGVDGATGRLRVGLHDGLRWWFAGAGAAG